MAKAIAVTASVCGQFGCGVSFFGVLATFVTCFSDGNHPSAAYLSRENGCVVRFDNDQASIGVVVYISNGTIPDEGFGG